MWAGMEHDARDTSLGFPIAGASESSIRVRPDRDGVPWRHQRQRDGSPLRSVGSASSEGLPPEPVTR